MTVMMIAVISIELIILSVDLDPNMEATMKVPTHIFLFQNELSEHDFELAKKRTKNKDFEKITRDNFYDLYGMLEFYGKNYGGGSLNHFYAIYNIDDYATLSLTKLKPEGIFRYDKQIESIINEAFQLNEYCETMSSALPIAIRAANEYNDHPIQYLELDRNFSEDYFSDNYEYIGEEQSSIIDAMNDALDEFILV